MDDYRNLSRQNFAMKSYAANPKEVELGCIQRIADAVESLAEDNKKSG